MVGVTSTAAWETHADHQSWQPQLSVAPESVCCKGLSEDRNDPQSVTVTRGEPVGHWFHQPHFHHISVEHSSRETVIVEIISTLRVWYARLWDTGIHRTWDKSAPTFNTYGQKTYSSDQLLKPQQWLMCSGRLGQPGLLEQQGKVQPSHPFPVPSSAPAAPQPQGARVTAGRPGSFADGFLFFFCWCCSGGGVCCLGFVICFWETTDILWVCLPLPLSLNDPFVKVTGQMNRWSSGAPFPTLP